MTAKYQTKKTSELEVGDVIVSHGMRLLVETELRLSTAHDDAHNGTRWTRARVLNRDELSAEQIPFSFTAPRGDETEPHFTIQGNDLATWSVEPPACPRCGSSGAGGKCASWCPQTPSEAADEKRDELAEYAIVSEYDALRSRMGHDYGSGQRASELSRRRREGHFDVDAELSPAKYVSKEELVAAFERVGRPKLRRAERELFRRETPATKRTLQAWAMVERWSTGARLSSADGAGEPRPTGFVVGTIVEHVDSGQTGTIVGRAIAQRSAGGALMQRVKWDHGFKQSDEGAPTFVSRLRERVVVPPTEKTEAELREIVSTIAHGGSTELYSDGELATARLYTGGASEARRRIDRELARRSAIGGQAADVTGSSFGSISGTIRRGDGGSAIRRAIERSTEERFFFALPPSSIEDVLGMIESRS